MNTAIRLISRFVIVRRLLDGFSSLASASPSFSIARFGGNRVSYFSVTFQLPSSDELK